MESTVLLCIYDSFWTHYFLFQRIKGFETGPGHSTYEKEDKPSGEVAWIY